MKVGLPFKGLKFIISNIGAVVFFMYSQSQMFLFIQLQLVGSFSEKRFTCQKQAAGLFVHLVASCRSLNWRRPLMTTISIETWISDC